MKKSYSILALAFVTVFSLGTSFSALAATTFTSEGAFVSALSPSYLGYYKNDFSSLTSFNGSPLSSVSASGGTPTVSYQFTSGGGLFINNDSGFNAVGNWVQSQDLTLSFTSGNVYAIGAQFYLNDINGNNQNGTVALTFSDGTIGTAPSLATGAYGFFGVISTTPITSLVIAHNTGGFLNTANLYVAAPVPEPASTALMLSGLGLLGFLRRKSSR